MILIKKLYFIFEQLPSLHKGGLISSYVQLANLLKDDYQIKIISVFNYSNTNIPFNEFEKIVVNRHNIDLNFIHILSYLKHWQWKKFFRSVFDMFYFFISIPWNRHKIRKLLSSQDKIIVSCPAAAIFMPKTPFILEIHTNYRYFFERGGIGYWQAKFMQKPSLILFRTKADANYAKAKLPIPVDYIYNFLDKKKTSQKNDHIQNKIIFMGRLAPEKQLFKMLQIAKELKNIYPHFQLDIYGDGPLKENLEKEVKKLDLSHEVTLKGYTKDKNVYRQYSLLWVTSSLEGLPMMIIEAKSYGVPVITTHWGNGVTELVHEDVDGFIIDDNVLFAKKTKEILSNSQKLKQLSKGALKSFEPFTPEIAYKRWTSFLEKKQSEDH